GFVDIGAAAKLNAKYHVHGIVATLFCEIDDFRVERDDACVQRGERSEDGPGDGTVYDGFRHRAALVHADNDGPVVGALSAGEEIDFFGNDRSEGGLIVFEVAADGPLPIDGWGVWKR